MHRYRSHSKVAKTQVAEPLLPFRLGAGQFATICLLHARSGSRPGAPPAPPSLVWASLPMPISRVVPALLSGVLMSMLGYRTPFTILAKLAPAGQTIIRQRDTGSPIWIRYHVLVGFRFGMGLQ